MASAEPHTLSKAHRARRARSAALRRLADGSLTLAGVLHSPPAALRSTDLWDVLSYVPKLGRDGKIMLLKITGVFAHTPIADLTKEERSALINNLPQRAAGKEGK